MNIEIFCFLSFFSPKGIRKPLESKHGWTEKERQKVFQEAQDDQSDIAGQYRTDVGVSGGCGFNPWDEDRCNKMMVMRDNEMQSRKVC